MNSPALPPPLPKQRRQKNIWPWIGAVLGLAVLVAIGGFVHIGAQRIAERRAARQNALHDLEKSAADERSKMADAIEKGETAGSDEAIGRLKQQLEKSAAGLSGSESSMMRALAGYLARLQNDAHEYEVALNRLLQAQVLAFKIRDREVIGAHRKLLNEFLTANNRVLDTLAHADDLARAELRAAKLPDAQIEAVMIGFNKTRDQRDLQLRIRECDRVLGETGLATLDLLEKNWGHWRFDETRGKLLFEDNAALEEFNQRMTTIQNAAADEEKTQQELVAKIRAAKQP